MSLEFSELTKLFIEHSAFFDATIMSGNSFGIFYEPPLLLRLTQGYQYGFFRDPRQVQSGRIALRTNAGSMVRLVLRRRLRVVL